MIPNGKKEASLIKEHFDYVKYEILMRCLMKNPWYGAGDF